MHTQTEPTQDLFPEAAPAHDRRQDGMHAGCDCGTAPVPADPWRKGFTRRRILGGSAAMVAALGAQTVTSRYAFSATKPARTNGHTTIVVMLAGGWDSLSIVVPAFERRYYEQRPDIKVPEGAGLPLARGFALHPALPALQALFKAGTLAPVLAVGSPDTTLSHFEARDTWGRGTATGYAGSGFMNRALEQLGAGGVFSAVAAGNQVPIEFAGTAPVLAMDNLQSFGLAGYDDVKQQAQAALLRMYKGVKHDMAKQVTDTLRAIGTVQTLTKTEYKPTGGAKYPDGSGFANALRDAARLIKAKVGLHLGEIEVGGWDMHTNQGGVGGGDMLNHLAELNACIDAFVKDLGAAFKDVTIVFGSEFGRTCRQNGSNGSDHGHAYNTMVIGGSVNGGKVYGTWPGLDDKALFNNGSLAARTDYRDVMGEILQKQAGIGSLGKVFPDHKPKMLGIVKQRG